MHGRWGKGEGGPEGSSPSPSSALRARLRWARFATAGLGLLATGWTAAAAQAERWPAGADIPVVAGAFAAPLAAYFLARGFEMQDRRLLWSLGVASLPLYLAALWVVGQALGDPGGVPRAALRVALLGASLLTGSLFCGLAIGAALIASSGDGPHPAARVLAIGLTTLPAAAAFGWALHRLPRGVALDAPPFVALLAALFVPWVARGLDRATTARAAAVAVVALGAGAMTLALHAGALLVGASASTLEGFSVEGPALALRLGVPVASLLPSLALVALLGARHGAGPATRTGAQTALGMAICTLPLLLFALALAQTRGPSGLDEAPAPAAATARGIS
jgi:hypothetical protein